MQNCNAKEEKACAQVIERMLGELPRPERFGSRSSAIPIVMRRDLLTSLMFNVHNSM